MLIMKVMYATGAGLKNTRIFLLYEKQIKFGNDIQKNFTLPIKLFFYIIYDD